MPFCESSDYVAFEPPKLDPWVQLELSPSFSHWIQSTTQLVVASRPSELSVGNIDIPSLPVSQVWYGFQYITLASSISICFPTAINLQVDKNWTRSTNTWHAYGSPKKKKERKVCTANTLYVRGAMMHNCLCVDICGLTVIREIWWRLHFFLFPYIHCECILVVRVLVCSCILCSLFIVKASNSRTILYRPSKPEPT